MFDIKSLKYSMVYSAKAVLPADFGMEVTEVSYMEFKMASKTVPVAPDWNLEPLQGERK